MSAHLLLAFPGHEALAGRLSRQWKARRLPFLWRRFPDGESYVRILKPIPKGATVAVLCTLREPDDKAMVLMFLAKTLKALGAKRVILVAPYLAYMRQDIEFHPGESVSSKYFCEFLDGLFDGVITVDPHLHRSPSLDGLFSGPAMALSGAPAIGVWVKRHVKKALIIGPDAESLQWVSQVAKASKSASVVLEKKRLGDRNVRIRFPDFSAYKDYQPVIVDDMISTGGTVALVAKKLRKLGFAKPILVGVHAVFASGALKMLKAAGVGQIVTADSIPHVTNAIALDRLLSDALGELVKNFNKGDL